MDENSAVLSQDAIDTLLSTQSSDDEEAAPAAAEEPAAEAPAAEPDAAPEPVAVEAAPVEVAPAPPVTEATPDPVDPVEAPAPAAPVAAAPPPAPAAPDPVTVAAPPPPGVTPPPGVVHAEPPPSADPAVSGVDEERAMMIAGEATESAIAPLQGDLGIISGRVETLEAALKKIETLEAEVARLKSSKSANGGISLEQLKPLVDRLAKLEKAAKGSPVFGLYDKFTCSSCASEGAAQVRARCGVCNKEGWFGRKKPTNKG